MRKHRWSQRPAKTDSNFQPPVKLERVLDPIGNDSNHRIADRHATEEDAQNNGVRRGSIPKMKRQRFRPNNFVNETGKPREEDQRVEKSRSVILAGESLASR